MGKLVEIYWKWLKDYYFPNYEKILCIIVLTNFDDTAATSCDATHLILNWLHIHLMSYLYYSRVIAIILF